MTRALKDILNCNALGLSEPLQESYSSRAMLKACQYVTSNDKAPCLEHTYRILSMFFGRRWPHH
jgi:hypothetical protein